MKRLIISLLLLSMVGVANADAYYFSCGYLHEMWLQEKKPNKDTSLAKSESAYYSGYVAGAIDFFNQLNLPDGFANRNANHVVGKWLENNPQEWHKNRVFCVATALMVAYGLK